MPTPPAPSALRLALGLLAVLSPAWSSAAELLVPAYVYPGTGGEWTKLAAAAAKVPLTVILNPASGPGRLADPAYIGAVKRVRAAGGRVVAYVRTDYGKRHPDDVRDDMDTFEHFYPIDGFFFDEMAGDAAHLDYYAALYDYAKSLKATHRVIGNPGTTTTEAYLTRPAADVLVTFESAGSALAAATPAPWAAKHPADHFAHILHSVATPEAMTKALALIARRNVGLVYVTDDVMANPYDKLPTYWDREVQALAPAAKP